MAVSRAARTWCTCSPALAASVVGDKASRTTLGAGSSMEQEAPLAAHAEVPAEAGVAVVQLAF